MKTQSQTGSAHVVVTGVLVVALLGALGFIFWQNFVAKKSVATTTTASTQATTQSAATPAAAPVPAAQSTQTALVLSDYGVEVPYDTTTDTYTAVKETTGPFAGGYHIYSKNLTAQCGGSVNVGIVQRFNKGDSVPGPSNIVALGNYQYMLGVGGYGDCGTGSGVDAISNAATAFSNAFKNLKATN